MVCNWAGSMGQPILLSVSRSDTERIRAPYHVTIRYDLRSIGINLEGEAPYLAALDVEKLRRKGSGIGLDALQASSSWIARDCLCSRSGRLKAISDWRCAGQVKLALLPVQPTEEGEAVVMFRIIVLRKHATDNQDWRPLGAPLVLRMDLGCKLVQQAELQQQFSWALARAPRPPEELGDRSSPEFWGVRLQQVLDFFSEIRDDADSYCAVHKICTKQGQHQGHHVCMYDPCPYRPINKEKYDDHRGIPFVSVATVLDPSGRTDSAGAILADMAPNTSFIVERYIRPSTRGTGCSMAGVMNHGGPLRANTFITHVWSETFSEFLDTLQMAVDPRDVIWLSCFSIDQNSRQPEFRVDDCTSTPSLWALERARKVVVVLDRGATLLRRLWCSLEIAKAREWRIPTLFWAHRDADLAALDDLSSPWDVTGTSLSTTSGGEDRALRTALGRSLEHFQLLPVLQSAWEADDEQVSSAARNERFRRFVGSRLTCLAEAFEHLAEQPDFSPEQLRQLHAEHERQVAVRSLAEEHQLRAEHTNQEFQDLRAAAARSQSEQRQLLSRLSAEHEEELDLVEQRLRHQTEDNKRHLAEEVDARRCVEEALEQSRANNARLDLRVQELESLLNKAEQELTVEKERYQKENELRMMFALQAEKASRATDSEVQKSKVKEAAEREKIVARLEKQLSDAVASNAELASQLEVAQESLTKVQSELEETTEQLAYHIEMHQTDVEIMVSGMPTEHDSMEMEKSTCTVTEGPSFQRSVSTSSGLSSAMHNGVGTKLVSGLSNVSEKVSAVFTSRLLFSGAKDKTSEKNSDADIRHSRYGSGS